MEPLSTDVQWMCWALAAIALLNGVLSFVCMRLEWHLKHACTFYFNFYRTSLFVHGVFACAMLLFLFGPPSTLTTPPHGGLVMWFCAKVGMTFFLGLQLKSYRGR